MNYDWIIDISVAGKSESAQIRLCSGNSGMHLNHDNESDALLYTKEDELFIERVGETPVEIERCSRKRLINMEHPIRIVLHDTIRVGASEYHIDRIRRMNALQQKSSLFGRLANKAILTGAATILLAVMPACKSSENPDTKQQVTETQNAIQQNDSTDSATNDVVPPVPVDVNGVAGDVGPVRPNNTTDSATNDVVPPVPVDVNGVAGDVGPVRPDNTTDSETNDVVPPVPVDVNCVAGDVGPVRPNNTTDNDAPVIPKPSKCENSKIQMMCLNNNSYQKCGDDGRWELVEECKIPAICMYDDQKKELRTKCYYSEPCEDGDDVCYQGTDIYKCENHQWKFEQRCPSDLSCVLDAKPAQCIKRPRAIGIPAPSGKECSTGEMKCDSESAVMLCDRGYWRYKEVCKDAEVCKSNSATNATCVPADEHK